MAQTAADSKMGAAASAEVVNVSADPISSMCQQLSEELSMMSNKENNQPASSRTSAAFGSNQSVSNNNQIQAEAVVNHSSSQQVGEN